MNLKENIKKALTFTENIHIIGFSGTEGEAAIKFLAKYFNNEKNLIVHDIVHMENLWISFLKAREFFPKYKVKKDYDELLALKTIKKLGLEYLSGIEKDDIVLLPQDWDRYAQNLDIIKKHLKDGGLAYLIFDLYYLYYSGTIIGITGTKGKTSTVHLSNELLKQSRKKSFISGNDRYSPQLLPEITDLEDHSYLILETSNRHLKHSHFSPYIGVITNIESDHLEEHNNDQEEYRNTKLKILRDTEVSILPYSIYKEHINQFYGKQIIVFSDTRPGGEISPDLPPLLYIKDDFVFIEENGQKTKLLDTRNINNNIYPDNILVLSALSHYFKIEKESLIKALNTKLKIKGRFEYLGKKSGIHFINDISATTPFSTIQAIKNIAGNIILISGGDTKSNDFYDLFSLINKSRRIKKVIILSNPQINNSMLDLSCKFLKDPEIIFEMASFRDALDKAYELAEPEETILLSPSCAHFYSNFIKSPKNSMKILFKLLKQKKDS